MFLEADLGYQACRRQHRRDADDSVGRPANAAQVHAMILATVPGDVTTFGPDAWHETALAFDELERVVSSLCVRFPECDPHDVERTVADAYSSLSRNARITTHLIPLTMNRCRRQLQQLRPA
jgi:hypothetical protein